MSAVFSRVDSQDVQTAQTVACPICHALPGEICAGAPRANEIHLARPRAARPEAQDKARRALLKRRAKKGADQ